MHARWAPLGSCPASARESKYGGTPSLPLPAKRSDDQPPGRTPGSTIKHYQPRSARVASIPWARDCIWPDHLRSGASPRCTISKGVGGRQHPSYAGAAARSKSPGEARAHNVPHGPPSSYHGDERPTAGWNAASLMPQYERSGARGSVDTFFWIFLWISFLLDFLLEFGRFSWQHCRRLQGCIVRGTAHGSLHVHEAGE